MYILSFHLHGKGSCTVLHLHGRINRVTFTVVVSNDWHYDSVYLLFRMYMRPAKKPSWIECMVLSLVFWCFLRSRKMTKNSMTFAEHMDCSLVFVADQTHRIMVDVQQRLVSEWVGVGTVIVPLSCLFYYIAPLLLHNLLTVLLLIISPSVP